MNTVTVTGWLQADPVTEHIGDLAVCELRLAVERPGSDRRTDLVIVTCFGPLAAIAVERLAVGDLVGVTGWLRTGPSTPRMVTQITGPTWWPNGSTSSAIRRLPVVAPDAHLEAAYEDRYELDEVW